MRENDMAATKGDSDIDILARLMVDTGIDLSVLPACSEAKVLAPVLGVTVGALAQDRYRGTGIPYTKIGSRIRYLRADVARYLAANRVDVA
jgi:hypothetical protein